MMWYDTTRYSTVWCDVIRNDTIIVTVLQGLEAAVKKNVSGDVGALLLHLLMPPQEHDAFRFQQAMAVSTVSAYMVDSVGIYVWMHRLCLCLQGLGTDEETLIEISCLRSRKQLDDISAAYSFCEWSLVAVVTETETEKSVFKCKRGFVVCPGQCIRRSWRRSCEAKPVETFPSF